MASFKFNLKGIKEVEKMLEKGSKAISEGLDKEMTVFSYDVNLKQKQYAPVDTGRLRGGNIVDVSKKLDKKILNPITYAPYIEFGTGGLVSVPAGLEDYAIQFKGKGIRQININAQPFFFRAYFEELPKFRERLKKLIEKNK